jgi:hypothetical protein
MLLLWVRRQLNVFQWLWKYIIGLGKFIDLSILSLIILREHSQLITYNVVTMLQRGDEKVGQDVTMWWRCDNPTFLSGYGYTVWLSNGSEWCDIVNGQHGSIAKKICIPVNDANTLYSMYKKFVSVHGGWSTIVEVHLGFIEGDTNHLAKAGSDNSSVFTWRSIMETTL